ncbi:Serine--tRNA ligase mitochondrial [Spathaspora sp. JA1]|nr:Serine--tRNA ligase mitochondrial [Spathaspora sp. JA1]
MLRIIRRYATAKNSDILLRPQINIPDIIARPLLYKESITRRQLPATLLSDIDFIIESRPLQSEKYHEIGKLKQERQQLAELLQSKQGNTESHKTRLKEIKSELKPLEKYVDELQHEIYAKAETLPNLLDHTVPLDPFQEDVVQMINCKSQEDAIAQLPASEVYDHKSICEKFNIVNFNTASRISGSSWYYLMNDGALLEQALVQYALSKARQRGYTMVSPPSIVKSEIVNACGFKPNDQNNEKQVYELQDEGKSLTGTAEIPLGALHSSTVFKSQNELPKKYVGVSRSYRAEAGASGKDTRGLYRVHEFTKVELFHFTTSELAEIELEQIKDFQIEIFTELGIMAKVMNMPTSDLGSPAMKKYDIEAWMPGRGKWGELSSSSNCGDYQARRLGIRYDDSNKQKMTHVNTLNGTCMAVPRVIVALIEQNYNPETNEIPIPKVLQPYMDGKTKIVPI